MSANTIPKWIHPSGIALGGFLSVAMVLGGAVWGRSLKTLRESCHRPRPMTQDELLKLIDKAAEEGWTELDLAGQGLSELPGEICKLVTLQRLYLSHNQLNELPVEIGQLSNLQQLDLSSNPLRELPAEIGQLSNLQQLNLGSNPLNELPVEIGQLSNLQQLNLGSNKLSELPAEIGQLSNLQQLNLGSNQLNELPAEIGQLSNLQQLELCDNQLSELPAKIGQLSNLRQLDLSFNKLSERPVEIGRLSNLRQLDLSYNQLSELPVEIGQLSNLQQLDLSHNQLSELLAEIIQLSNLQQLELRNNPLSELPVEIGQLSNLQRLDLRNLQLSELPVEIGQLSNLRQLELRSSQLSELPAEIGQMSNLQQLYLRSSQLSELPVEIGQLSNLQQLDLRNNKLSELPVEIGRLSNLQQLDLSHNLLSELPVEIGQLSNLQQLDFSHNLLSELPVEIGQLSNLQQLDLSFNHRLQNPPPEIVKQHTHAILNYLRQKLEQGLDRLYEAKFLIVGEGGAGKTSLAKKILDSDYDLDTQEASTEGIEVMQWDFKLSDSKDFRANIWDFGGQEIYHATHQFFLTKRSLYVLVVDTRQDNTDLYYWLSIIELLSDSSPVFIIKNEKQDRQCEVNERQLRGEFDNLKETLATNLKRNRGLEEIKIRIQQYITTLPHVGTELPKKWVDVRRALETDERNYIRLDQYIDLCNANGFTERANQLQLSEYLHDLGVCLHFQADPLLKNYVILKPEWGTTAVYKALDTQAVRDNLGRFSRGQLDTIWGDAEYDGMRDELLQLMMRFKLCYRIPGTEDQYIAPQLLAVEKPDYDWDEANNLLLRYHYAFMPKGIITRFIVEMHECIEAQNLVWKSGAILAKDSARAEVIELYHKGEIHIRVSGNRPKELLTVITHEIDTINKSYERIQVDKRVICNCQTCQTIDQPHFFSLDILNRSIEKGKRYVQCHESLEMVDAGQLLVSVKDPAPGQELQEIKVSPTAWRLQLRKTLRSLPQAQFEDLLFALNPPSGSVAASSAQQSNRVADLLAWAESELGCGLETLESTLNEVLNDPN